ncbi:uncharacterized protein LOC130789481 [Actinidia eriantha]|uniref:uncharacterized protein LOC130789481 n=1 Tax=Actinidia eriantha TaxID=165200 RepID=UPI002588B20F|nr:uncharacterized protein LOC130789481 [Actinidia eriantha]XP_057506233.1 uncharacterized protein LOC130789481 [Actinidia eriantha]XP_057506234.1 uncharacterized protein LOC130789481 [Actinidia eriantha]XP_057506235.1 uncharacterized protein LOC130789481 [Actinidia eriantha]XP_057506236.1 uncharacterized protein LOC130789481 [Actinidia eriantha]
MTPFEYNFEVPQSNYEWDSYNACTYSPPSPWVEEFVYNEPCPICFSHSHLVTECYRAHEFPEFVQNYVYTTQGFMNPSSDNSYSCTHNNEWETYANSSWTQEPWVDDANTSYISSHYTAPLEQQYQHDYLPLHQENPNFEDSMLQTLRDYEAGAQKLTSNLQSFTESITELGIQVDKLVDMFNEQEERKSLTQGQQEPVWEEETYCEDENSEVCEAQSEPNSFEVDLINENHETLAQDLVTSPKEFIQCEDKIELLDCPTKSYIDVRLIDFLGVDEFNWVVDPYLVQLVNNQKTTLIKDGLVVEYRYSRRLKNKEFSKYLIIWYGRIQFLLNDLSWDPLFITIHLDGGVLNNWKPSDDSRLTCRSIGVSCYFVFISYLYFIYICI